MGGAVAMQCAIRHPDKVRRAVIIFVHVPPNFVQRIVATASKE
jgi:pimeloyl-ACP methyl ester carboxylesterase